MKKGKFNPEELATIKHEVKAKAAPSDFPIRIVAIDGHGGAGKSTLANELAKEIGAEILHTDDFASWDNTLNWWPRLIQEVFEPIQSGARSISYLRSTWGKDHKPEPVSNQPVSPVMILEGVSSARKEFRPYLTYAIWVETPRGLCLQRGLERDGQDQRDRWENWFKEEDEYIARDQPQKYADKIVSGAGGI